MYQLAGHNDKTRASTRDVFKEAGQGTQSADYNQLLTVLKDLLGILEEVFIVIDALDEGISQNEIHDFLQDLWKFRSAQTRVLVSSNTTQPLESDLTLESLNTETFYIESEFINGDIEAHIQKLEVYKYRWHHEQRNKIVKSITESSDGS